MDQHSTPPPIEVVPVVIEELGVVLNLPAGWDVRFDEETRILSVVGNDSPWCNQKLCPSITVRSVPFLGDHKEFERLASESLTTMPTNYQQFELRWDNPAHSGLATRCYSFLLKAVNEPVIQVQGLIDSTNAASVFVVDCTAPQAAFPELEDLYRQIITSVQSLGPDWVAPDEG